MSNPGTQATNLPPSEPDSDAPDCTSSERVQAPSGAPTNEELMVALAALSEKIDALSAPPKQEPLWRRRDIAAYLHCSPRFVDSLIADGQLIPIKLGSLSRFDPEAVRATITGGKGRRVRR